MLEMTICVVALVGLPILIFIGIRERARLDEQIDKQANARILEAADIDGTAPESLFQVPTRLGGYNGTLGTLIIGQDHLFAAKKSAVEVGLLRISYEDVISVEVEQPSLPYIMNLNMAATITNEQTRQQAGLEVVVSYNTDRRIELAVFGGFSPRTAFELRDRIDNAMD